MMLLPRSNSCASDSVGLDSASCRIGTEEAVYARMEGGVVPAGGARRRGGTDEAVYARRKGGKVQGGAERSCVCDTPVICANDSSSLAFGWKKYLTTDVPVRFCDSVCSTSLTVVCAVRSVCSTRRSAISSGDRPVYFHTAATTGILMFGKMSVGVRRIENTPRSMITMASTMKVYGRCSASLTIHMASTP